MPTKAGLNIKESLHIYLNEKGRSLIDEEKYLTEIYVGSKVGNCNTLKCCI
jgi:hypothetical protein